MITTWPLIVYELDQFAAILINMVKLMGIIKVDKKLKPMIDIDIDIPCVTRALYYPDEFDGPSLRFSVMSARDSLSPWDISCARS